MFYLTINSFTTEIADLVPDHMELARSAVLEDKQLFFLQCAMEENCLSTSTAEIEVSFTVLIL